MKKVISLVLVLSLVLSSFSFAFGTTTLSDIDGEKCEEAVETLLALGIVNGYDNGKFKPEKPVTRAEIAKMLIVALGYEEIITSQSSDFNDTKGHWADKYIAFAAGQGIVNGYTDGSFRPDAPVSYDEAITMIIRALGYTDESLAGSWPTNYKIKALDLDITDGVKIKDGGADRGGVAMLLYNTLECKLVSVNADNEIIKSDTTVLDRTGEVLAEGNAIKVTPDIVDKDDDDYVESNIDLEQYMYETVEAYTSENEDGDDVVVYISDFLTATIEGEVDSVDADDDRIVIEDKDEDTYEFSTVDIDIYFNGAEAVNTDIHDIEDAVENDKLVVTIKAVFEADEDGDYVEKHHLIQNPIGIVISYATDVVQIDDEYDDDDLDIDGIELPIAEDDDDDEIVDYANLIVEGDETSLDDIEEDDIVTVFASDVNNSDDKHPQAVKLIVTRDTIEGKVTKQYDDNTFKIDGKKVDTSEYYKIASDLFDDGIELADQGVFYLDEKGEVIVFNGTSKLEDYAVIVGVQEGTFDSDFGDMSIDDYAQVKIATSEGETIIYDLYSEYDSDDTNPFESFELRGKTEDDATYIDVDGHGDKYIALDNDIKSGTLIKYDLNKDDQIDELEIVNVKERTLQVSGSDLGNSYRFTNSTIIFDATGGDYNIISLADIDEDENLNVKFVEKEDSTFGNLEAIIIPAGFSDSTENGVYAMLQDLDVTLNKDDDRVQELLLLIDGDEETYYAEDDNVVSDSKINKSYFNLYELTLDDDIVTDVDYIVDDNDVYEIYGDAPNGDDAIIVQAIDAKDQVIRFNHKNYPISDDAVVYISEYDEDDLEWKDIEVGDLDDIDDDDYIKAYNLDADDDDDEGLDVIILFTGDVEEYISIPATNAVEQAEDTEKQGDVNVAQALINALEDSRYKDDLQERLDDVKDKIAAEALSNADEAVEEAEKNKNEGNVNTAQTLINALENSRDKDDLQDRLDLVKAEIIATTKLAAAKVKVTDALTAYDTKTKEVYTSPDFAAIEKKAVTDAITAYKLLAADADDDKYDAQKSAIDTTNTNKQADYFVRLGAADQNAATAVAAYESKLDEIYSDINYAVKEKSDALNAIEAYKLLAEDADDDKYDARKTAADNLNTLNQNVCDALKAYETKIALVYNDDHFALVQKTAAVNAIDAYKAVAAAADDAKYDTIKSDLDDLDTLNKNVYDTLKTYEAKVALVYNSENFAVVDKGVAATAIESYKTGAPDVDDAKYDTIKSDLDDLDTLNKNVYIALKVYKTKTALAYDDENFALVQKTAAETAIDAYKADAPDVDDAKYDPTKTGLDELNAAKQGLYDAKKAAETAIEANYTPLSWTSFSDKKTDALLMPESNIAEMNAKTTAINEAIGVLKLKTP